MHIHYFQHAAFEHVGSIRSWCNENGHKITGTKTFETTDFPDLNDINFLIIMGGPQSAVNYQDYPYLEKEVEYIKAAIKTDKLVLGVCLGAQLIAIASGGKAVPSPYKEIGLFPIKLNQDGINDPVFSVFNSSEIDSLHWHNDMAVPPEGFKILASSEGCPIQVFSNGKNIYGLQCHFELTRFGIEDLIKNCLVDFKADGPYIMDPEKIKKLDTVPINLHMNRILEKIIHLNENTLDAA